MRILVVNKYWYIRGGAERVAFDTVEILKKHRHEVEIFGMHDPKNTETRDWFSSYIDYDTMKGWKKISAAFKFIYNKEAARKFEAVILNFKPDIIHFHNIYHQLSFSLIGVAQKLKIPTVMTLHDYKIISPNYALYDHGAVCERSIGGKWYKTLLHNCMESWPRSLLATIEAYVVSWCGYRQAITRFIAPSRFLKSMCVRGGISENKIDLIPNPIDVSSDHEYKKKKYIVYVGRLSQEKGIEIMLEAAKLTADIPYVLVGEGTLREVIESKIEKDKIQNVTLVGYQKGEDLRTLIGEARLAVLPSVCYENNPLSVLEGYVLKTLSIGSRIGGIPELIPEDLLASPGNAGELAAVINKWYNTTEVARKKRILELHKSAIKEHSFETYYERILKTYQSII